MSREIKNHKITLVVTPTIARLLRKVADAAGKNRVNMIEEWVIKAATDLELIG